MAEKVPELLKLSSLVPGKFENVKSGPCTIEGCQFWSLVTSLENYRIGP